MKKYAKLFYALVFCFALSLCGAVFAACGQEEETVVSIPGQIVFESRNEYDYDTGITLTFPPNEGELRAPASLSYRDSVGRTISADGFTLVKSEESYALLDGNGQNYALDLVWDPENPDATTGEYNGVRSTRSTRMGSVFFLKRGITARALSISAVSNGVFVVSPSAFRTGANSASMPKRTVAPTRSSTKNTGLFNSLRRRRWMATICSIVTSFRRTGTARKSYLSATSCILPPIAKKPSPVPLNRSRCS